MKKLPLSRQITFALIVVGVAMLTSFLLAFTVAALSGRSGHPLPSPLIGLSLGVVAGVIYIALSNNRKVPVAGAAARQSALAPVTDGSARLLVYRQGFVGKLAGVDVYVDGEVRTQLKSPRFAALLLAPGSHTVQSEVQSKRSDAMDVTVAPNETVAVQIVMSLGKTKLVRQDAEAVRGAVAKIPMVQA